MSQPVWEYVTNLGDSSPIDNGGLFVYRDTTGVYGYEMELLREPESVCYDCEGTGECKGCDCEECKSKPAPHCPECLGKPAHWTVYRVCLDKLKEYRVTNDDGTSTVYLVQDSYNPATYPHPVSAYVKWFAKDLAGVASYVGTSREELVTALCSDDGIARADAYRSIYDYHGWENGDGPSELTRAKVEARYTEGEL